MSKPDAWVVHKFGGSSVADADCFRKVATIVESAPAGRLAVVLSACKGVTDALLRLVALAERQDDGFRDEIAQLRVRHAAIAEQLLTPAAARSYRASFDSDCRDLSEVLHSVKLTRAAPRGVSDLVSG
jgi:bifunctional aspartokinase / homoserine dehydrogenase 1